MSAFELAADAQRVRFWLSRRLPLEPKGEFLEARVRLREAIRALEPPDGRLLYATYHSLDESYFDVENVLFYNVGSGTFSSASKHGIAFDRVRQSPRPAPSGRTFGHFHEYSYAAPAAIKAETVDATLSFVPPRVSTSTKTHDVWWRATEACGNGGSIVTGAYRLRIDLAVPYSITNIAAVLKSLVDGIIASLHADATPSTSAVARLAAATGWDPAEIARRLASPPFPVLGPRRTVGDYREFVKWDPADHLCESLRLRICHGELPHCDVWIARM